MRLVRCPRGVQAEAFDPIAVTPYHYRNADRSLSNISNFKALVEHTSPKIAVNLMDFYPYGPLNIRSPTASW
jgi:hypothetical protein